MRITYAGPPCPGTANVVSLSVAQTAARALARPVLELPAGQPAPSAPIDVKVESVVDLDGRLRYASASSAPAAFGQAAIAAAAGMRFEPARINGTPTPMAGGIILTFTSASPSTALPPDARPIASIPPSASTSEMSTPDVARLTAASSLCPIADDATYGASAGNPIKIGGGAEGAAREQQYLTVLRGPAGQGLRYQRTGSVLAVDREPVLDVFDLRYAGMDAPIRLFFDRAHAEALKAPKGFVCAAAMGGYAK